MVEKLKANLNLILIIILMATMVVSYFVTQRRLDAEGATVSVPVVEVSPAPAGSLETFRAQRDETALQDMAALQALCGQEQLDQTTREDAAAQLQRLVEQREKQLALEGALAKSALAPCVAVISEGSVTIVTDKESVTSGETALVMTMAQTHAGVEPSGVRVVTATAAQ